MKALTVVSNKIYFSERPDLQAWSSHVAFNFDFNIEDAICTGELNLNEFILCLVHQGLLRDIN